MTSSHGNITLQNVQIGTFNIVTDTFPIDTSSDAAETARNAHDLYNEGRYREALSIAQERLLLATDLGERGALLTVMGHSFLFLGELDKAEATYNSALTVARSIPHRLSEGASLANLGNVARLRGEFEKAEKLQSQALDLGKGIPDPRLVALALGNLGSVYFEQGRLDEALAAQLEALSMQQRLGDLHFQANALGSLGNIYVMRSDDKKAEQCFRQARAIHERINDREGLINDLINLGNCSAAQGRLDESEALHQQALKLAEELGSPLGQAHCLTGLGTSRLWRGDLAGAKDYYARVEKLLERPSIEGRFNEIIAGNTKRLREAEAISEQLRDAERAFARAIQQVQKGNLADGSTEALKALAIAEATDAVLAQADIHSFLAFIDERGDAHHEAITHLQKSLSIYREIGERVKEADVLGRLGNSEFAAKNFDKALDFHKSAIAMFQELRDQIGRASCRERV
jgi:ATP-dependent transcriptional regulator